MATTNNMMEGILTDALIAMKLTKIVANFKFFETVLNVKIIKNKRHPIKTWKDNWALCNFLKVDLGNVPKLHLLIFRTSSKTGVRLQAPQKSEAVQKIEKKETD